MQKPSSLRNCPNKNGHTDNLPTITLLNTDFNTLKKTVLQDVSACLKSTCLVAIVLIVIDLKSACFDRDMQTCIDYNHPKHDNAQVI